MNIRFNLKMLFIKKSKNLIAGPYYGEFGWELMSFQGYVRKLRKFYENVAVISYNTSNYLYEKCIFFPHSLKLEKSSFGFGIYNEKLISELSIKVAKELNFNDYDLFTPFHINRINKLLIGNQEFKKFYEPPIQNNKFDIVFHFRYLRREDGDKKNYNIEYIRKIFSYFEKNKYKIGFIGLPQYSYALGGEYDLRSNDLRYTISIISNSRLVVGGSSAPMHLAQLCDKPIVVWIGKEADIDRYISYWNPFNSPVFVVSDKNWQPKPEEVINKINEAIEKLNI
ncbi:MAG: hypothetical protein WHS65_13970 [Melioribacteraceae bacterium]